MHQMSCGEIGTELLLKGSKQSVFHRNFENVHSRLAALGLGSDRLPRNATIYYVKPATLDHSGICKNKTDAPISCQEAVCGSVLSNSHRSS